MADKWPRGSVCATFLLFLPEFIVDLDAAFFVDSPFKFVESSLSSLLAVAGDARETWREALSLLN
jgi:hypothetical protein